MKTINERVNNHQCHNPVLRFVRGDYESVRVTSGLIEANDGEEDVELSECPDGGFLAEVFGDGMDEPISDDDWKSILDETIFS